MSENYNVTNEPQQGGKGMAIASMVLGIISIVAFCYMYFAIPCAIIGLILGILHNKRNVKSGMATAGIICSIIGLVIALIILVLIVIGAAAFGAAGMSINEIMNMQ